MSSLRMVTVCRLQVHASVIPGNLLNQKNQLVKAGSLVDPWSSQENQARTDNQFVFNVWSMDMPGTFSSLLRQQSMENWFPNGRKETWS